MTRKPVALLAAVVLALVGTILLVTYVRAAEDRAVAGEELVPVLVLTSDVKAGTPAADLADHVKTEKVPAKVKAEGAVTSVESLIGKIAAVDLVHGEQVVSTRFATVAESGRAAAPDGLLEVTVPLEPHRALGGQLQPGEKVAVVITIDDDGSGKAATRLVLHKIVVTAVQVAEDDVVSDGDDAKSAPTGNLLVTLAVDGPSVEKIVFAAEQGHLWLAAEPDDASTEGSQTQTRDSVLR
ncbi:MAG: Flp pilus assembly protein CpaB [Acidimicrobiia bacterium]